jgi:photosystem II stability/assembly factor-like uncharacterized protein
LVPGIKKQPISVSNEKEINMKFKTLLILLSIIIINIKVIPQMNEPENNSNFEENEDHDKVKKIYSESMTPNEYSRALETSGMAQAKNFEKISSTSWLSIGPVGGIPPNDYNGRISGIYIRTVFNGYYVYAGACSGGLWRAKSSAGIGVWSSLGDGLPNPSVRAFAVHPNNPDDIIVGTGDYDRYKGGGMFHTNNAGLVWTKISLPNDPNEFYKIEYLPADSNVLVAACTDGVLRSTDGGTTWKNVFYGEVTDLIMNPQSPSIQYLCLKYSGVYKSTDSGVIWALLNSVTSPFGRATLAISQSDPNTLAVIIENGSNRLQGVFTSNNGGINWNNVTNNISGFATDQTDHAQAIVINPNDTKTMWVATVTAYETTDGGLNWEQHDIGHADFANLYYSNASGNILWAGNDGGIFAYQSGSVQNWNGNSNTGLRCSQVDFMDSKRGFRTIGLQDNGINLSTDYGGTWTYIQGGDGFGTTISDDRNFTFWFTDGNYSTPPAKRVYKKTFNGNAEDQPNSDGNLYVHWYDRNSKKIYLAGTNSLLSKNEETPESNWKNESSLPLSDVHLLSGCSLDGQTIYITNENAPKIIIARKNGNTWNFSTYDFKGSGSTRAIHVSTDNPGEAWVGLRRTKDDEPNIYHTVDFGNNWTDISTKELQAVRNIQAIVTKPINPNEIYVGTDIGVFISTDAGMKWEPLQDGLPIVRCTGLRYVLNPDHSGSDFLILSTFGRGMFERIVSTNPVSYVDQNATGFSDGTYDYPYQLFSFGYNNTNAAGILALRSNTYFLGTGNNGPLILKDPKTFTSYGGPSKIELSGSGPASPKTATK